MAKDFNHPKVVERYDEHIRKLIPAYELMHLQIQAILTCHLKPDAKILIVGCGTGYELQYLVAQFPYAQFVAIDPSLNMLDVAKQRISKTEEITRVEFIHGDTATLLQDKQHNYYDYFDAALAILVVHFIDEHAKSQFFQDIHWAVKKDGLIVTYDLMRMDQTTLNILFHLTQYNGLSEKQSINMIERLEDDFALIDAEEMKKLLIESGFEKVGCYMQVLGFYGFYAFKAVGKPILNQYFSS